MAADLKVPVDDPVGLEVVVVLAERVDQLLGHLRSGSGQRSGVKGQRSRLGSGGLSSDPDPDLQPSAVEEELQQREDGDVEVKVVT